MTKLGKERASNCNDWKKAGLSLINLHHRKIISKDQVLDLFYIFSLKADKYEANGVNKFLDINIPKLDGKDYGIKFFQLECLKTDNKEYYDSITKNDLMMMIFAASQIVVNLFKDILIVCNGVLNVKDNDVWVSNHKEVDNVVIVLNGKLEIKFYGADGKQTYFYDKFIKHIKDCISLYSC